MITIYPGATPGTLRADSVVRVIFALPDGHPSLEVRVPEFEIRVRAKQLQF